METKIPRLAHSDMTGRVYFIYRWNKDGTASWKVDVTEEFLAEMSWYNEWSATRQPYDLGLGRMQKKEKKRSAR